MRAILPLSLAALLALHPAPAAAEPDTIPRSWAVVATAGFELDRRISGDTDSLYLPVSARFDYGPFSLALPPSYLEIDGPDAIGGEALPEDAKPNTRVNALNTDVMEAATAVDARDLDPSPHGIGDTLVGFGYLWSDPQGRWPLVELGVEIKIPTADAKQLLGTGKVDVSFEVELAKQLGRIVPFASLRYSINGGPVVLPAIALVRGGTPLQVDSETLAVRNTFATSVGVSAQPLDWLHVGLIYDWVQSAFRGGGDSHELVPFASLRLSDNVRIGPYLVVGLSHASPEIGYATQVVLSY